MSEREDTKAVVVGASRGSAVGVSSKGAARTVVCKLFASYQASAMTVTSAA